MHYKCSPPFWVFHDSITHSHTHTHTHTHTHSLNLNQQPQPRLPLHSHISLHLCLLLLFSVIVHTCYFHFSSLFSLKLTLIRLSSLPDQPKQLMLGSLPKTMVISYSSRVWCLRHIWFHWSLPPWKPSFKEYHVVLVLLLSFSWPAYLPTSKYRCQSLGIFLSIYTPRCDLPPCP